MKQRIWMFVAMVWFGGLCVWFLAGAYNKYRVYKENPAPVEMTLADYLNEKPDAEWLKLTRCQVDYPQGVFTADRYDQKTGSSLFIPVYPNSDRSRPAKFVLYIPKFDEIDLKRFPKTTVRETIEGVIRPTKLLGGITREHLRVAKWRPAADYIAIEQGDAPSLAKAEAMLGLAVLMLAIVVAFIVAAQKAAARRAAGIDEDREPVDPLLELALSQPLTNETKTLNPALDRVTAPTSDRWEDGLDRVYAHMQNAGKK